MRGARETLPSCHQDTQREPGFGASRGLPLAVRFLILLAPGKRRRPPPQRSSRHDVARRAPPPLSPEGRMKTLAAGLWLALLPAISTGQEYRYHSEEDPMDGVDEYVISTPVRDTGNTLRVVVRCRERWDRDRRENVADAHVFFGVRPLERRRIPSHSARRRRAGAVEVEPQPRARPFVPELQVEWRAGRAGRRRVHTFQEDGCRGQDGVRARQLHQTHHFEIGLGGLAEAASELSCWSGGA